MQTALLMVALLAQANSWSFTFKEVDGNAVLDTDGVTIIFEGIRRSGMSSGSLQVAGDGSSEGQVGGGNRVFTDSYVDGVCTMTFAGHTFKLTDKGKKLTFGKQTFDLSDGKKTFVVKPNGMAELKKVK